MISSKEYEKSEIGQRPLDQDRLIVDKDTKFIFVFSLLQMVQNCFVVDDQFLGDITTADVSVLLNFLNNSIDYCNN